MVTSSTPSLPINDQPSSTNPLTASLNPLNKFLKNYWSIRIDEDRVIKQMPNYATTKYERALLAKPLTKCPQDSRLTTPTILNFST